MRKDKIFGSKEKTFPYLRVATFFVPESKPEKIRSLSSQMMPEQIRHMLRKVDENDIKRETGNKEANQKSYNSLCYALFKVILLKDGWKITYADISKFEDRAFGVSLIKNNSDSYSKLPDEVAFVAEKNARKIYFCFKEVGQKNQKLTSNGVNIESSADFKDI